MWSHYANSYAGICVEYDFEKIKDFIGFVHPVSYTTVRPTLSMADLGIAAADLKSKDRLVKEDVDVERIISYLCCKNKCWQYEDEWRIINIERKTPRSSLNCHALNLLHSGRTLIACANDYYLRFVKARAFRAMICA